MPTPTAAMPSSPTSVAEPDRFVLPALAVGTAAAALMALEICGPRMLAPAFGSGTIVWAVLLAAVMLALFAGNLVGGRLADHGGSPRTLAWALLAGAALQAGSGLCASLLATWLSDRAPARAEAQLAALAVTCVLLFALPAAALATASPVALRLALPSLPRAGRTYALLQACAALGSLAGVLLPPLLLVPAVGTRACVLGFAALPALAALALLSQAGPRLAALLALILGTLAAASSTPPSGIEAQWESSYAAYRVLERGQDRLLAVNPPQGREASAVTYSVHRARAGVLGNYFDVFPLAPGMAGETAPRRILIIGLAGGTAAVSLRAAFPEARIEAVEIDATLIAYARRQCGLDALGVETHVEDGRRYVRRADPGWDLVVLDAFVGSTPPSHLVSREFFDELRLRMAEDGLLAVNVMPQLAEVVGATVRAAFPHAVLVEGVVVAATAPLDPRGLERGASRLPWPGVAARARQLATSTRPTAPRLVLTDDCGGFPWWWGLRI